MNLRRMAARGVLWHRRMHLGLLLGALLASAVLSGALLVGASVKGTLRGIALARLGGVAAALDWGDRHFTADLADAVAENGARPAAAVLSARATAAPPPGTAGAGDTPQLNRARLYGVDAAFAAFAETPAAFPKLGPQEVAVNAAVAARLGLKPGDDLTLRMPRPSAMPLDAPLARGGDRDTVAALVTVKAVLDDNALGRFSLAADQAMPLNLFADRAWLQELLELPGKANLLLAGGDAAGAQAALRAAWRPEQAGYSVRSGPDGWIQVESDRIFLEDAVREALANAPVQPTLTYLVDRIALGGRSTPYSFVVAAPVCDAPEDAACVSPWLAEALGSKPGDRIELAWSAPGPDNTYETRRGSLTVHAVLPEPALALERALAPRFPGLTDVDTCRDWDIGMPLDEEALNDPANEEYWKAFGQTPKLVVSYETGKRLWGSRFGALTALRLKPAKGNEESVRWMLQTELDPAKIGLAFQPVRETALRAVDKALDFGGLFTGMSFFLVVSALVLLGVVFAHGVEQRAGEVGALLAVGWTPRRVRRLFLAEAGVAAAVGAAAGAVAGGGYAWALLEGLRRFWPGAVADTPVRFHLSAPPMVTGAAVTLVCALVAVWVASRRATRRDVRALLAGAPPDGAAARMRGGRAVKLFAWAGTALALGAASALVTLRPENPSGLFFGVGFVMLAALLAHYAGWLARRARHSAGDLPGGRRLAAAQLARRGGRSLAVAAMTAAGCFLVLSTAAMRANLALHAGERASGTGGFAVFAETTLPARGGAAAAFGLPEDAVVPLRARDGEEAGCLNLNRAQSPRLAGVNPARLAAKGAFAPPGAAEALWGLLETPLPGGVIPALVGDSDTAMWGLQATTDPVTGTELEYLTEGGEKVRVRLVGRLPMRLSVFQGMLLVSERDFTRLYPGEAGHRMFLLEAENGGAAALAARLNREQARLGMEAVPALDRLRAFYAVETAYLSLFLVLGGLGMALGAGGAGVVILRNLYERRAELALFHALGYPPALVRRMLLAESALLVSAGVLIGAAAAAVAVAPLVLLSATGASPAALAAVLCAILAAYLLAVPPAVGAGLRRVTPAALRAE